MPSPLTSVMGSRSDDCGTKFLFLDVRPDSSDFEKEKNAVQIFLTISN